MLFYLLKVLNLLNFFHIAVIFVAIVAVIVCQLSFGGYRNNKKKKRENLCIEDLVICIFMHFYMVLYTYKYTPIKMADTTVMIVP